MEMSGIEDDGYAIAAQLELENFSMVDPATTGVKKRLTGIARFSVDPTKVGRSVTK